MGPKPAKADASTLNIRDFVSKRSITRILRITPGFQAPYCGRVKCTNKPLFIDSPSLLKVHNNEICCAGIRPSDDRNVGPIAANRLMLALLSDPLNH
jgi:hypothetical protein